MQTNFLYRAMVFLIAIFLTVSCSKKSNTQGALVPANASFVFHFNGEAIMKKLPWEEVKSSELFKQIYSDSSMTDVMKTALNNPENTGIDVKKDIIFFVVKDTVGGYAALEGSVKDASRFQQFCAGALKNAKESEKEGIHFLVKDKFTYSWNKERFIILIDAPEMKQMNQVGQINDSTQIPVPAVVYRDGTLAAVALFNLKSDNSLTNDDHFSELMGSKGDLHFWINGQSISESAIANSPVSPLAMLNLNKLAEGSVTAGTADFENGKIVAEVKSYSSKVLSDLWKKYSSTNLQTDMIRKIPSKNIAAVFALNFKPEGIKEFLKIAGMDGFANMGASRVGFTLDEFIKANGGDILFAVSDIKRDSMHMPDANVLFVTSIGDKTAFSKLVAAGKQMGPSMTGIGVPGFFYNSDDRYFALGNKQESVDLYAAGASNNSFDFTSKISGGAMGGYVNFQYILSSLKNDASKDSIENAITNASLNMWDNMFINGGEFKNGAFQQHVEVNLLDKTTNSLKQLNRYFGIVGGLEKKRNASRKATLPISNKDVTADSLKMH